MSDTDSLLEVVQNGLLACARDALLDAKVDDPSRRAIWHTKPVMDWSDDGVSDTLLAVWIEKIEARAMGERRSSGSPGEAQLAGFHTVALCRIEYHGCYPNLTGTGSAPEAKEVTAGSLRLTRAAWAVWTELCARRDTDTLFDTLGAMKITKADIGIGSMTALDPTGYSAGWRLNIEVALPAMFEDMPPGS